MILIPLVISIASLLIFFNFDFLLSSLIKTQLVLKDGDESLLFESFVNVPIPIHYGFYFYNIDNPRESLRGSKPRMSTIGPFCFKQLRNKKIVGWGDKGETIKYLEFKKNFFSPETTGCKSSLDEEVTVVNPPIAALGATIADIVKDKVPLSAVSSPIIMSTISAILAAHSQNLFMKRTVKELILGFRINILDTVTALLRPLELLGFKDLLPGGGIPNNTFGLLYGKNNTPEGPYEVYTGKNSNFKFVSVNKYKNKETLSFWKSQYCNQLKGSDGSMFGPGVKREDELWSFAPDLCRSIPLSYKRDGNFKGVPTYVFGIDDKVFGTTDVEPKNECFCSHPTRSYRCKYSGTFDLGACQGGAPLIVSKPHFLGTDPDLSQYIEGFAPNSIDDDSLVEVEPLTGVVLNGLKKLQFALRVENVPFLRGFNRMNKINFLPFAQVEEKGSLPDEIMGPLSNFVFKPLSFIQWFFLILAIITLFIALRNTYKKFMLRNNSDKALNRLKKSAQNVYKKKNTIDSELSSTKSKNLDTDFLTKSRNPIPNIDSSSQNFYSNLNQVTEPKSQAERMMPSNLNNSYFPNNQPTMQSFFPQYYPILALPFPVSDNNMNSNNNRNDVMDYTTNELPMITNLNSISSFYQKKNSRLTYNPPKSNLESMKTFSLKKTESLSNNSNQTIPNEATQILDLPFAKDEEPLNQLEYSDMVDQYYYFENQPASNFNEKSETQSFKNSIDNANNDLSPINHLENSNNFKNKFEIENKLDKYLNNLNSNELDENFNNNLYVDSLPNNILKPGHDQEIENKNFQKTRKLGYDYNYQNN